MVNQKSTKNWVRLEAAALPRFLSAISLLDSLKWHATVPAEVGTAWPCKAGKCGFFAARSFRFEKKIRNNERLA